MKPRPLKKLQHINTNLLKRRSTATRLENFFHIIIFFLSPLVLKLIQRNLSLYTLEIIDYILLSIITFLFKHFSITNKLYGTFCVKSSNSQELLLWRNSNNIWMSCTQKKLSKKVLFVRLEACMAQGVFYNPLCVWFGLVYVIEYLGT